MGPGWADLERKDEWLVLVLVLGKPDITNLIYLWAGCIQIQIRGRRRIDWAEGGRGELVFFNPNPDKSICARKEGEKERKLPSDRRSVGLGTKSPYSPKPTYVHTYMYGVL
jgi:hypothetical protein